ncbi:hypothetical protein BO70DRAFT_424932 [Aspergillus heteromorphus CBS 117.55]|uniref:Uncharacterized protein n=1 Tax=Aspergillus heteromorphus CBS 117.55 TaxID=1448321 RepID=A0A317X6I9_9EURO|nr:uncharacterized protein BO70DRAFT_424932 [Aspergillus heteromorphus CBS 117.55]PWY92190.1 hypothetical protein BO70DRAFT_424932 [Aspergillus heteromorphus CBS 117.55]
MVFPTAEEPLIPLVYFAHTIYEAETDQESKDLILKHFSADASIKMNKDPMDRAAFIAFVLDYRSKFTFLDFEFHEAVSIPTDDQGRAGTAGFGMKCDRAGGVAARSEPGGSASEGHYQGYGGVAGAVWDS